MISGGASPIMKGAVDGQPAPEMEEARGMR